MGDPIGFESLPKRDQKALLHYLDALVQKNVAAG